jgi:flagellar L-ring protein precursor FlgH
MAHPRRCAPPLKGQRWQPGKAEAMAHPCRCAPPLKGQRWQPGKAGSAAFWVLDTRAGFVCCFSFFENVMSIHLLRVSSLAMLGVWLTGCASLQNTPVVDVVPVSKVSYAAPAPVAVVPTGGIFQAVGYRPAFEDPRARLPGDSLTIQITEQVSASQKSSASIDRSGRVSASVSALPFLKAPLLDKLMTGAESSNGFDGQGATSNTNTFSGSITATVLEVLPNGHLVVAGEKQIGVNQNVDVLRFSGTVDPRQIQPGNLIPSTQVANARIESRGRGAQGEALSIGWLGRFFLSVIPF